MSIRNLFLRRVYFGFVLLTNLTYLFFGTVNNVSATGTTRYVASSGTDSGNCSSSASPCLRIQYAVNQSASGDKILVAQGTYMYNAGADLCSFLQTRAVVCALDKSLIILGGYSTSNWSVANPNVNLTVIDGANTYRGVVVMGYNTTTANVDMEGFTIQNGRALGPLYIGQSGGRGGGMWVVNAAVTLKDIIFKNNRAIGDNTVSLSGGSADGSGLTIESSPTGTSSLLERVTFDGNQSLGGVGPDRGGVAFGALFVYASTVTVQDSTFINNLAQGGNSTGNGISGGLNADALGGAIGLAKSLVTLTRIVVANNSAIGGNAGTNAGGAFGGGIYSEDGVLITINDSTVTDNTARGGSAVNGGLGAGGGVLIYNSPVTIDRIKVIANNAIGGAGSSGNTGGVGGGGLYLWRSNASITPNTSITNSIVSDNYATSSVGGAFIGGGGGGIVVQGLTATITHTTIARNRLGSALVSGQGLLILAAPGVSSSVANLNYSIVADHTAGGTGAVAVLVQSGNTVNFNRGLFAGNTKNTNSDNSPTASGTFNGSGTMLSAASVGFVSPGSPNFNYDLQYGSAAKDQATGSTTTLDINGRSRPFNGVSDLGAYEYESLIFPLSAVPGNSTLYLNWAYGVGPITGSVSNYEVVVTCPSGANAPNEGNCGQPINAGVATTFTLTGLSNYQSYTMIVNAYNSSHNLITNSATVTIFPSDLLIFLPIIVK